MSTLTVKNLSFSYINRNILKDINFSVDRGQMCALLGPNGSGKTTLLKSIIGIRKPKCGDILINNSSIFSMKRAEIARIISLVPQQTNVVFNYTVIDMIMMAKSSALHFYNSPSKNDIKDIEDLLFKLGISYLKNKCFNELSGGEKQLIMIARALFQNTEIILLDEPTSQLDFKNQFLILDLVKAISLEKKLTVIITLHDPNLARYYCEKTIMIKSGELLYEGLSNMGYITENLNSLYNMNVCIENIKDGNQIILPQNWYNCTS